MPRYFGHCPKDSLIQGGLADLSGKVMRDRSDRRNHLSSLLKIFNTHERIVAASPAADEVHRRISACAKPRAVIAALVRICETLGRLVVVRKLTRCSLASHHRAVPTAYPDFRCPLRCDQSGLHRSAMSEGA
jgi:hypothetical protein